MGPLHHIVSIVIHGVVNVLSLPVIVIHGGVMLSLMLLPRFYCHQVVDNDKWTNCLSFDCHIADSDVAPVGHLFTCWGWWRGVARLFVSCYGVLWWLWVIDSGCAWWWGLVMVVMGGTWWVSWMMMVVWGRVLWIVDGIQIECQCLLTLTKLASTWLNEELILINIPETGFLFILFLCILGNIPVSIPEWIYSAGICYPWNCNFGWCLCQI